MAYVIQSQRQMVFNGTLREAETFGDLGVGEVLFAAEAIDQLPLGGHSGDGVVDEPGHSFRVVAVGEVAGGFLTLLLGQEVFQTGLLAPEVVAGFVAGDGEQIGVERLDADERLAVVPDLEEDILREIGRRVASVQDGPDEAEDLGMVAHEHLLIGVFLASGEAFEKIGIGVHGLGRSVLWFKDTKIMIRPDFLSEK